MAMTKSIGRTFAQIDVAANFSVRLHEDFFNSHSSSHQLSQAEIDGDNPCSSTVISTGLGFSSEHANINAG